MDIEKSKISIRIIAPEDVEVLTAYRLDYLTELQGERSNEYKLKLKDELEIYFRKSIQNGSFYAILAEYNNHVISFGGMVIKQIPGDFNKATYQEGDILNMYTIPAARRQGISSMILAELLKTAKSMGISKVALHTSKDGEQLYRKFGFTDPAYPYLELNITS